MSTEKVRELGTALRERISRVIIGQDEAIQLLMVALLSEGHVLFEGPPGTGKTLLARAFAACLKLEFKRVQFTPDLMPGDIVGTNLFNFQTNTFAVTKGPIFTEILLADEINRTPPKTQAALLRGHAGAHGHDRRHVAPALRAASWCWPRRTPSSRRATYPLPEAQLDRFLFKVLIGYPGRDEEVMMVRTHGHQTAMPKLDQLGLAPLCDLRFIRVGAAGGGGHPSGGRDGRLRGGPDPRHPQLIRRCSMARARGRPTCWPPPPAPPPCWRAGSS